MFPCNDEENEWISRNAKKGEKFSNRGLVYSLLFAVLASLFSTLLPPLIYFSRTSLF